MKNVKKEKRTAISIKMSVEERDVIAQAAKAHGETSSGYVRRILMESALNPIYTGKDVVQILMGIGYDMRRLSSLTALQIMLYFFQGFYESKHSLNLFRRQFFDL